VYGLSEFYVAAAMCVTEWLNRNCLKEL